jgi:hypothetical protein
MNRYHNGKIYKLVNTVDDSIYVGSTSMPLSKRLSGHKRDARKNTEQRVYKELNKVGWSNVRIVLIEAYHCENKNELIAREQHHIDLLKPELNKNAASGQRCIHDRIRSTCKDCGGSGICEHERQRHHCKDCGGSGICEHNKKKSECKDCGGSQICIHDIMRRQCKDCCGSAICEHDRMRTQCKDCGGSGICIHNKHRFACKDCGGSSICIHDIQRSQCRDCGGASICIHNKRRCQCKDCGGSGICIHNKHRLACKVCSPVVCELCDITTSKGDFNRHLKSDKHLCILWIFYHLSLEQGNSI